MPNLVYFNRPQLLTQLIAARTTVVVAGRRTGKTDSIAAPYILKMIQRMPGSTGGIVVPTFKHGLTNTLPGLFAAWARWGFKKAYTTLSAGVLPRPSRRPSPSRSSGRTSSLSTTDPWPSSSRRTAPAPPTP